MDYQVWIKEEFGDNYTKVDCGDLAAAKRKIDEAVRAGGEPILTVEVPYKLDIKVSEVGSETPKSKARDRKDTRDKSKGDIRPGDAEPVSGDDQETGDLSASDNLPDR